jgi:methionyl-tRNA formyltransferase
MSLCVVVVTQDDPFYVPEFFETFFESLPSSVEVDRVVELDAFGESTAELARRMYGFYGPVNFLRRGVSYVGRQLLDGVGDHRYSVGSVAADHGADTVSRESVNEPAFVESLKTAEIDVLLSVSAPEIFDTDVLAAPRWGCLNVHTARLPEYRGMMPTFWALYHDDEQVGITVHTMAEEIDRGEAVRRDSFDIDSSETLDDVIVEGKRRGGRLAAAALGDIEAGRVKREPLDGEGSYFSFPTPEERRELQRRGRRLL